MYGVRFVSDVRLKAPNCLIGKSGPRIRGTASIGTGNLILEAMNALDRHGAFSEFAEAKGIGVRLIYEYLGGKVCESMISRVVGDLPTTLRQERAKIRAEVKSANSGN